MPSAKEKAWLSYYLGEARFNGAEAARLAGYAWPDKVGWAKKEKFKDEIREHLEDLAMDADEALYHLAEMARAPYAQHMGVNGPDMGAIKEAGLMHLIKKIKRTPTGGWQVEFYDRKGALDTILKVLKRLDDGPQVTVNINNFEENLAEVYGDSDGGSEGDGTEKSPDEST